MLCSPGGGGVCAQAALVLSSLTHDSMTRVPRASAHRQRAIHGRRDRRETLGALGLRDNHVQTKADALDMRHWAPPRRERERARWFVVNHRVATHKRIVKTK